MKAVDLQYVLRLYVRLVSIAKELDVCGGKY
jgi:hypothetical protein